jgi:hypothetical protein
LLLTLPECAQSDRFSYRHLPTGYHWRAVYDEATNAIVYYGRDPITGDVVYVGPDDQFFIFRHPGPIARRDLTSHWNPHDAP